MSKSPNPPRHRDRDGIVIAGDYQASAHQSERLAQRFWHQAKVRLIERVALPAATDRVLDAGCGSGTISHFLAAHSRSVIGCDSNPAAIEYARQAYPEANLSFLLGQFENLATHGPFDWIYSLEVVEHLYAEQVSEALQLFKSISRPGGHLFITTPNYRSAWPVIEWTLDRLRLVPHLDEDQHITHFNKSRLKFACEETGWSVVRLGTFNGLSPFVAPLSYSAALGLERMEHAQELLPGNLLFCVCRNDGATGSSTLAA